MDEADRVAQRIAIIDHGRIVAQGLDPLTYGIDGLRSAFIGVGHFSAATNASVLAVFASIFLALRAYAFSRIQV